MLIVLFEQLLRANTRADQRQLLRPVVTAKHANHFGVRVVNRTTGETVATVDLYRPVFLVTEPWLTTLSPCGRAIRVSLSSLFGAV